MPTPSEMSMLDKQSRGETTSELLKRTIYKEEGIDKIDIQENDSPNESPENELDNGSEVSFDEDNLSEGKEDQAANLLNDNKNLGGGRLMSWGTGYQKGMKLGYQSPEEKVREKMAWESTKYKLQDDRLTVATSNGGDR
jgi:hypothetical protein